MTHEKPTKQYGAVLVFAADARLEQIEAAIDRLVDDGLLDNNYFVREPTSRKRKPKPRPPIESFDPEWGGPVWYVP